MSYTNITIPHYSETAHRLALEVDILKLERDRAIKQRDDLISLLENIPDAIREFGYVEIRSGVSKETIKLVVAPTTV